jgi:hypothetical protein
MNPIRLSPLEWHILVYLWKHGASLPEAIYDALALIDPARPHPSFFQTMTILDTLCYAGYLDYNDADETYWPVIPRAAADRWYYRWPRGLIWWVSGLFKLDWSSNRQHMFGFNGDLPGIPPGTSSAHSQACRVSLAHPKLLSKRYASAFRVHIYFSGARRKVVQEMEAGFGGQKPVEHTYTSRLKRGEAVQVKLYSPVIDFSDPVIKKLDGNLNLVSFLGKPKEGCYPGNHRAMLVICDPETGYEHWSVDFPVKIVDYAFGRVSRPLLANCMAAVLGLGSLAMYILTLLGQIDATLGLASGTTAVALAGALYARFASLYRSVNVGSGPSG